jgi:hypothetical protein
MDHESTVNCDTADAKLTYNYLLTFLSGLYYKSFTIVIYDRNDSTIVEPVL